MSRLRALVGSIAFFVLAPVTVVGVLPYLISGWRSGPTYWGDAVVQVVGGLLVAAALGVLVPAFARFVTEGRGTPAPIAPTERLVIGGLYRSVRNPMYVAVVTAILGQAMLLNSWPLLLDGGFVAAAQATFVRLYEEPTLRERYGVAYDDYRAAVPAWLPWPRRPAPPDQTT